MLPLMQFFFFQLAATGSYGVLQESGVVNFISHELVHLNQLTSWNEVTIIKSWQGGILSM